MKQVSSSIRETSPNQVTKNNVSVLKRNLKYCLQKFKDKNFTVTKSYSVRK